MLRKVIMGVLALVCVVLAAACSRNTGDTNGTPDTAATGSVTPGAGESTATPTGTAADPTATVTATPTTAETTPTGTVTPTVTPEGELNLAEVAARNRELHELTAPGTKANPLGTSPELSEPERFDIEHGIARLNSFSIIFIDGETGEGTTRWNTDNISVQVVGLNDAQVAAKIKDRVETAARAMVKPEYLPNVAGVMTLVKERGLPVPEISCRVNFSSCDIVSLTLGGQWYWEEIVRFDTIDDYTDFYYNPPECEPFDRVQAVWYEKEDGYVRAGIGYYLSETVHLNFDLATGEELSLSDLFPKGTNYLDYLNEVYEESIRYKFEFNAEIYEERGEILGTYDDYDETREYDGGAVRQMLDGSESFYVSYDRAVYLVIDREEVFLWLANPIRGRNRGKDLYTFNGIGSLGPIGSVIAGEAVASEGLTKIESIRLCLDGKHEITVSVFRGTEGLTWRPGYDAEGFGESDAAWFSGFVERQQKLAEENFSDENIIELVKQSLKKWPDGISADRDFGLVLNATTYPNGFYRVYWEVVDENGRWMDLYYDALPGLYGWVKDGKLISEEELFDVSYRELFTKMFLNMRIESDGEQVPVIRDEDQAKAAADLLLSHYTGFSDAAQWPLYEISQFWFERWAEDDGTIYAEAERLMGQWKDNMSYEAWKQLMEFWRYSPYAISYEDSFMIPRHLRMYQDVSFE